jgi:hypothetical protein
MASIKRRSSKAAPKRKSGSSTKSSTNTNASSKVSTNAKPKQASVKAQLQVQQPAPEEKESLTVDGSPYAPISIRKAIEHLQRQGHFDITTGDDRHNFTVFINNSGNGYDIDDADTINVTIQARVDQSNWFVDEVLPKLPRIPAYLYRYVQWVMFDDCSYNGKYPEMKYKRDNDYIQALASGILKQTDEEYQQVYNFIRWAKSNSEATHLVGLIQLVGGTMLARSKKNLGCMFYIEFPETGFHPKRERLIVTLLNKLKEEYGLKKDWTPT